MLTRLLTETEYAAYVWTPLIRYAFMEQDIRISRYVLPDTFLLHLYNNNFWDFFFITNFSGEVGSLAYEKLKKLAQQQSKTRRKSNDYINRDGGSNSGKCEN